LQKNPDDNNDVAVDEHCDDHVERAIFGVHSKKTIKLGGADKAY
jgi:hypothetical protein